MIVIFHSSSLVQPVALDFCDAATAAVNESASVVHALARVNLTSANRTGLVTRVILVMIVILKIFPTLAHPPFSSRRESERPVFEALPRDREHLSVLEWLNSKSEEKLSFFGVEVEVLKIDDSKPAINFKVVSKPDEWKRMVREKELSERESAYQRFFESLLERLRRDIPGFTVATKAYPQSWLTIGAGRSGIYYAYSFARNRRFRVELYVSTGDKKYNKEIFDRLRSDKDSIEKEVGTPLSWERLDDKKDCRIAIYLERDIMEVIDDQAKLDELLCCIIS